MYKATANLPLHGGKAPRWLFERMVRLARAILLVLAEEFGTKEILIRLSDPYWFQGFGCLLGFDWHSSGVTTTVMGAVKEGIKPFEKDLGFFASGGKGKTSLKTPQQIEEKRETFALPNSFLKLIEYSRLTAKIDNNAVQDGYQLYHHSFLFTKAGDWSVVQQGMNEAQKEARRYHWYSGLVADFVNEPHAAVCCNITAPTLNFVAQESEASRNKMVALTHEKPEKLLRELKGSEHLQMPHHHPLAGEYFDMKSLEKKLNIAYEANPQQFVDLVGLPGIGGKTLRALSLLSLLLFGEKTSERDPAKFSFAHGGKDGFPYPVDRKVYDGTIHYLQSAISKSKLEPTEKFSSLKRLKGGVGQAVNLISNKPVSGFTEVSSTQD